MVASSKSNQRKAERLGMPFGTASSILKKRLLYYMAEQLNMLDCFKCGIYIDSVDDFSIEHKESWFNSENPVDSFFNIYNIAFSHTFCNRPETPRVSKHGTRYKYDKHKCRCVECREIHSKHMKKRIRH